MANSYIRSKVDKAVLRFQNKTSRNMSVGEKDKGWWKALACVAKNISMAEELNQMTQSQFCF